MPERATVLNRSEKSAEAIVAASMERRAEGIGVGAIWFSDLECLRCS
jgi:hypothetical protein